VLCGQLADSTRIPDHGTEGLCKSPKQAEPARGSVVPVLLGYALTRLALRAEQAHTPQADVGRSNGRQFEPSAISRPGTEEGDGACKTSCALARFWGGGLEDARWQS